MTPARVAQRALPGPGTASDLHYLVQTRSCDFHAMAVTRERQTDGMPSKSQSHYKHTVALEVKVSCPPRQKTSLPFPGPYAHPASPVFPVTHCPSLLRAFMPCVKPRVSLTLNKPTCCPGAVLRTYRYFVYTLRFSISVPALPVFRCCHIMDTPLSLPPSPVDTVSPLGVPLLVSVLPLLNSNPQVPIPS